MHTPRVLAFVALLAGCSSTPPSGDDLGGHRREVSSASPAARAAVERGLVLLYAFNHDGAIEAFQEALRLDPSCPMAWWGIAHANGPHINNPEVSPERAKAGREAADQAIALLGSATPVEQALIRAQDARFSRDPAAPRGPLDRAYAEAMDKAWEAHPQDPDVGTLRAEALMDLQPWDLWDEAGRPKGATTIIVNTLEAVLRLQPDNPGANHLYVHAMEASPTPDKAQGAADRLRTLVPGAGHLVHMPAHIDARLGHWGRAIEANQAAIEADRRVAERTPKAGFYRLYMLHNHHFLAWAAMQAGRSELSLEAARAMVKGVPAEFIASSAPVVDGYMPVVLHVLVRFGKWDQVLQEPAFPPELIVANAVRHYARGVALSALGRVDEAEAEARELAAWVAKIDDRAMGNNPARRVLEIPVRTLAGEIAFRKGDVDEAVAQLRQAVAVENELRYDEPPDWMTTPRHPLAAILLSAGRHDQAREVLLADLRRFPENGWALRGLVAASAGEPSQRAEWEARFQRAWAGADVQIDTPCMCVPGAK